MRETAISVTGLILPTLYSEILHFARFVSNLSYLYRRAQSAESDAFQPHGTQPHTAAEDET